MAYSASKDRITDSMYGAVDSSKEMVSQYPLSSTTGAFFLGFGVGLALVMLTTDSRRHQQEESLAYRYGKQMLDAITQAMPESLAKYAR